MESIYKTIKEKRKKLGLTQVQLGEKVNACYVSICHLEQGRNVNTHLLRDVCKFLNIELTAIDKDSE